MGNVNSRKSKSERYKFHPVDVNDVINDRYRIIHFLGEGTFSMVWLAEDLRPPPGQPRLVSLKIAISYGSEAGGCSPGHTATSSEELQGTRQEVEMLRHIQHLKRSKPSESEYPSFYAEGGKFIVDIYDEFTVTGPNGAHQCIVMEFCGPSLSTVLHCLLCKGLPPLLTSRLAVQLAQAVAFLQGCNIAHGDLHTGNILLYSRRFRTWGAEEAKRLGSADRIRRGDFPKPPHGPKKPIEPVNQGIWVRFLGLEEQDGNCPDIELRLVDFGQSYLSHPKPPPFYPGIPAELAAPEVLVRKCILHAADVPVEPANGDPSVEIPANKRSHKYTPEFRTLSDDQLMDPEHNLFLKTVHIAQDSPLFTITPRADLWSLGGALFCLFEPRDTLFAAGHCLREAELILFELGRVFGIEEFLKIPEFHPYDPDREPPDHSIKRRCKASMLIFQPHGLVLTIESLMKIVPEDRCDAVRVVEMLQKTWPDQVLETMETIETMETMETMDVTPQDIESVSSLPTRKSRRLRIFFWLYSLWKGVNAGRRDIMRWF